MNRLSKSNNSPLEIFEETNFRGRRKKIATINCAREDDGRKTKSGRSCCWRTARNKAGESINWRTLVPAFIIPVEGWPRVICYLHIIRGAALRGPTGRN